MKQEILDLIEEKNIDLAELNDAYELEDELNHDGSINDLIDSNIDIYNYDLRKWAVDNYEYVEDAIAEGLVDTSDFDFHKAIQSGQYLKLREEANELIEEIFNEFEPEDDSEGVA